MSREEREEFTGLMFDLLETNRVALQDTRQRQSVFNVHTRVLYRLPRPLQRSAKFPLVGMLVDASVRPYNFKLIQGSCDLGTQIYGSKTNSWEVRSSRVLATMSSQMECRREGFPELRKHNFVKLNRLLYIHSEIESILVYDINKDIWSTLRKPPGDVESMCKCIRAWQGQLFGVRECCEPDSILIWELASPSKRKKKYNQMPAKLYKWLYYIQGNGFKFMQDEEEEEEMLALP